RDRHAFSLTVQCGVRSGECGMRSELRRLRPGHSPFDNWHWALGISAFGIQHWNGLGCYPVFADSL
ncbi:MAG TPA: hypothetical protein VNM37_03595, partial [Candidatus Dormibacteraeota bacterium]|nr:hypothetical protein [Candidatus Dormibacteraeota bacterium]